MIGTATTAFPAPADEGSHRMPQLLSVNVGMPRDVSWQGKTVYTGVWKHSVSGPQWSAGSTSTGTARAT